MATKKAASKKAPAKATKPAQKAGNKSAAQKNVKTAASKKAAPASKKAAPATKKAAKVPVKSVPVAKKSVAKKEASIKGLPDKSVQPVKKATIAAPSQEEIKTATKPFEKHTEAKEMKQEKPEKKVVIPKTSTDKAVKYEPEFTKSVLDGQSSGEGGGPTMRYSDAELMEFRELIQKKLDAAKKELAYLQGLITRKDESGDMEDGRYMTMEDGSMSMEREQLSQMASRQIQFIDHLEKALMRIENKTYGICRVTGKLIDKARLRAVPHATLSIEAKQMMNK
ncbi:MAG: TraR/DksA family transcriptional regulator [Flavisolibacter sp.]|nr:TraR/DksA family transcriptional regulator [Flavisolibacter sp.]